MRTPSSSANITKICIRKWEQPHDIEHVQDCEARSWHVLNYGELNECVESLAGVLRAPLTSAVHNNWQLRPHIFPWFKNAENTGLEAARDSNPVFSAIPASSNCLPWFSIS